MKIRFSTVMMYLIVLLMAGFSIYFYPSLPEQTASHWNARGEVDGYMPKAVNLSIMPAMALFMVLLFLGIIQIDPLRRNIQRFRGYYDGFIFMILLLLMAVQVFIIAWNLGFRIRINVLMPIMISLLFFGIGCILDKIKPNWFMGIRTPWTLSNPVVWQKTHAWNALLFKLASAVVVLGAVWESRAIVFVLVPVLTVSVVGIVLSYIFYRQETSAR